MSILGWIIAIAVSVYVLIGLIHATTISADKTLTLGQFWTLALGWPWKGRSWI